MCEEEVTGLLKKGAVVPVTDNREDAFYSNMFCIPKKSKGFRPIINLKGLNHFIVYEKFKMEGIETVKQLIRPGDWLVKLDLKDAYLTVPLSPDHGHFVRFIWNGRRYQFKCLPFGLSSAPRVFTKLLKPVVAFLRELGIRLVLYLDDWIIMHQTKEGARRDLDRVVKFLLSLGFLICWEKMESTPTQVMEFLGLIFGTVKGHLFLPQRKVSEIIKLCDRAISSHPVRLRDLSVVMGHFAWAIPTVPFARIHYRNLQRFFISQSSLWRGDLSALVALPKVAKLDLMWWRDRLAAAEGKPFFIAEPDMVLFSDASLTGWGGHSGGVRTRGPWSVEESTFHINELEILAAFNVLKAFAHRSRDITIDLYMDNMSAVCYLNKGGGTASKRLTDLVYLFSSWCEERRLTIRAFFLPGKQNSVADEESRSLPDASDWQLCTSVFYELSLLWKMDLDLFSSSWNAQLPRFVSWMPQPGAEEIDAFSLNWAGIFPPFALIPKCLAKIRREGADVIFICPYWPSRPYFPLLLEMACDVPRMLPPKPDLLRNNLGSPHPLASGGSLRLIALKLSGDSTVSMDFRNRWSTYCWTAYVRPHQLRTSPLGTIGVLGVWNGIRIPCVQM